MTFGNVDAEYHINLATYCGNIVRCFVQQSTKWHRIKKFYSFFQVLSLSLVVAINANLLEEEVFFVTEMHSIAVWIHFLWVRLYDC